MRHTDHTEFDRIMPDQNEWEVDYDVDYDEEEEEYDDNDNEMGPERSYFE